MTTLKRIKRTCPRGERGREWQPRKILLLGLEASQGEAAAAAAGRGSHGEREAPRDGVEALACEMLLHEQVELGEGDQQGDHESEEDEKQTLKENYYNNT